MDPPEETMLIGEAFQGSRLSPVLPKTALAGFDAAKFLPKSAIATTLAGFDTANLLGAALPKGGFATALAGFDAAKFLPKSAIATTLAGFDTANLLGAALPKGGFATALAGFDAAKFLPKSAIATTLAGFDTANLLGAALPKGGFATALAGFDAANLLGAAMALSSVLGTSSLAATFTGGQESLLPGLPISRLARDTGLTAGFRRTQDFSAPPPGSRASLTATTSEWSGLSDIRELRELATRMAQSVDGPVGEQASSNDTASSSWIRRHNVEAGAVYRDVFAGHGAVGVAVPEVDSNSCAG